MGHARFPTEPIGRALADDAPRAARPHKGGNGLRVVFCLLLSLFFFIRFLLFFFFVF